MVLLRNKIFLFLALGVAAFLLSLSVGGEFLHDHIHHHATQEAHDDCPVYQLMTQFFIFVVVIPIFFAFVSFVNIFILPESFTSNLSFNLPHLRAPPITL